MLIHLKIGYRNFLATLINNETMPPNNVIVNFYVSFIPYMFLCGPCKSVDMRFESAAGNIRVALDESKRNTAQTNRY